MDSNKKNPDMNLPQSIMSPDSVIIASPIDFIKSVGLKTYGDGNINVVDYGNGKIGYSSDIIFIFDSKKIDEFSKQASMRPADIGSKLHKLIYDTLENNGLKPGMDLRSFKEATSSFSIAQGSDEYFSKLEAFAKNIQESIDKRNNEKTI
jgi:hypothetical protein